MGVNWLPGKNPETAPRLCYIPKISLPTVFGDALSYMEMINQINYHFNEAIDDINKLAEDITATVEATVEGAKIPIYANLVHNGSNILSPNNWNIDKPEDIWDGMAAGKMCILFGKVGFNIDGIPVVQNNNNMYFILTEFYQTSANDYTSNARAVFVSYTYDKVSYIDLEFAKVNQTVTSSVVNFTQYMLPTSEDFEAIYKVFKKDVCIYKGDVRIGVNSGDYIELTDNASVAPLNEFFVVQTDGEMLAPKCAPCIVVDYYNGVVGELRYGGDINPWARIYSTGIILNGEINESLDDFNNQLAAVYDEIDDVETQIGGQSDTIGELQTQVNTLGSDLTELSLASVNYTAQSRTASQKATARNNIGAVSAQDPHFTGEVVLDSGYGAVVNFTVTTSGNKTIIYFNPVKVQIDGLLDPTSAQMAATKNYVDNAVQGVDAVKYSEQNKTTAEQEQARANIGAVGTESPHFYTKVEVENENKVLSIAVSNLNGQKVVTLGGTTGDALVKNVADPVEEGDAANKRYVDNRVGEINNAVLYVPQTLTESQKNIAVNNIGARRLGDNDFYDNIEIENAIGDEYDDNFITLNWSSSDTTEQNTAFVKYNGSYVKIIDSEEHGVDIYLGDTYNDKVVTKKEMDDKTSSINIEINSAENAWTVPNPPSPSYSLLPNIIAAYSSGKYVLVSYPTTGVAGVGFAAPKCVSLDTGIIVEAYNGSAWKRYTINTDGTVTTTSI